MLTKLEILFAEPQGRVTCGKSPYCEALQLYVLSGVIGLRCGGENRCQAAGGHS